MEYNIKITGSGSPADILTALRAVADQFQIEVMKNPKWEGTGKGWEDDILFIEITEQEK